jgi:hypothetical protein
MTMNAPPVELELDSRLAYRMLLVMIESDPELAIEFAQALPPHVDLVKHVRTWGLSPAELATDPETQFLMEEARQWLAQA